MPAERNRHPIMEKPTETFQEDLWRGSFGDEYAQRNRGAALQAGKTALFARILARAERVRSAIEFGANIGLNLRIIRDLLPQVALSAVEINASAVGELQKIAGVRIYHQSVLDFKPDHPCDLVLCMGVLIHLPTEHLGTVYDLLYATSSRYVCLVEYYNPVPTEVAYRGLKNALFKRDFAGELMDRHKDLSLVDYGFVYHRDPIFPLDDVTWFLLEKS